MKSKLGSGIDLGTSTTMRVIGVLTMVGKRFGTTVGSRLGVARRLGSATPSARRGTRAGDALDSANGLRTRRRRRAGSGSGWTSPKARARRRRTPRRQSASPSRGRAFRAVEVGLVHVIRDGMTEQTRSTPRSIAGDSAARWKSSSSVSSKPAPSTSRNSTARSPHDALAATPGPRCRSASRVASGRVEQRSRELAANVAVNQVAAHPHLRGRGIGLQPPRRHRRAAGGPAADAVPR